MDFSVRNLSYKYSKEGRTVLDNVSFSIEQGKVTAIVGPSGCGKTTLLEILSGVIPTLISNGELSGTFDKPADSLISVVSQTPENQLFGYGVEDAIAFGLENMGIPQAEIAQRMDYVLDLLSLQYLRSRSVANLSGGQRQAVCIASVLAMQPDILIMDEPVSSLDPNGKRLVQMVLKQISLDGNTVILVDNNLVWSAGIVDHIIGMLDGKVVFDGSKEEFFQDFELQHRLGVIIPQEVEIYRGLLPHFPDLKMFYTVEDGLTQLAEMVDTKLFTQEKPEPDEDEENIISVHNLEKVFNDNFHALIDVNANIPGGKIVAILGQNGSGKTTFVKHLNGLYKPTSGDVRYKGQSLLEKSVAQISRNIILVFQHPEHMLFEETVEAELTFCARQQGIPFTKEKITEVLEKNNMLEDRETFPLNLSMGKKHILTILSVLFSSADVIILDEPTLGMDGFLMEELENLIQHLKAQGKTVIVISHEIPMVFRNVDHAIILNKGKKIFQGSRQELAHRDDIFDSIHISMPPVVVMSKALGFDRICYNVADFVEQAKTLKRKEAE
ncbi:MAG: ABC transporter ATP-binding protein [Spirochaetia bacterium]|nr:ABC transporter ATP-binding protein [Spirochaetia bacterium]MBQ6905229.1 ABC transporter ATP-binding protein [Spirochaetia bacterium]